VPAPIPAVVDFLAFAPEFSKAPLDLVNSHLAMAARRTNADAFWDASTAQDAVILRAAYTLAISPYSIRMKLADSTQADEWKRQLYELQRSAVSGIRVF
jgi:hypothetical protein